MSKTCPTCKDTRIVAINHPVGLSVSYQTCPDCSPKEAKPAEPQDPHGHYEHDISTHSLPFWCNDCDIAVMVLDGEATALSDYQWQDTVFKKDGTIVEHFTRETPKSDNQVEYTCPECWYNNGKKKSPTKIKTLQYLVVPRANKGEDAFKWVAFYSENQAKEPYTYADTPEEALAKLEEE